MTPFQQLLNCLQTKNHALTFVNFDFSFCTFEGMDLSKLDFRGANFTGAYFKNVKFHSTWLCDANFQNACFMGVDFYDAKIVNGNFNSSEFWKVNFDCANLSGATGFPNAYDFLHTLEQTAEGVICYKCFGKTTWKQPWKGDIGEILTEVVNPDRSTKCGCGVNVCNKEWMENNPLNYKGVWRKILIRWIDLADVIVPYRTDGKFRCGKCEVINSI